MARRKNSNEAIESVEPTDIEMDVENEEYDSQDNVNEEAEINTKIESTESSESETEPAENSESENSDSDENPDNPFSENNSRFPRIVSRSHHNSRARQGRFRLWQSHIAHIWQFSIDGYIPHPAKLHCT